MRRIVMLCALLPFAGGCYLLHGRDRAREADGSVAPTLDAGSGFAHDAAMRARRDAGGRFFVDGGPLPGDEPDVLPGERPSDDPSSGEWTDPPRASDDPCCDVGEIVGVDDLRRQGSPPLVAWEGREWGVAFSDQGSPVFGSPLRAVFRRLDTDARPTTELRAMAEIETTLAAMAYGNGRFAIVSSGLSAFLDEYPAWLHVVDREGAVRAGTPLPTGQSGFAVARHPLVHGWAVATLTRDAGGGTARSGLVVYDDALTERATHDLEVVHSDAGGTALVSMKRMLVVATGASTTTTMHTFEGTGIVPAGEVDVGPLGEELAAARLRDTMVVVGRSYARSPLRSLVWDPFARRALDDARMIGWVHTGQGLAIAGDDLGGTLGVCYPSGGSPSRDADSLSFVLLGPDGAPIGEPVVVGTGYRYVITCAVASSGRDTYVVLWWSSWEETRHSILAARVTVRR